MEGKTTYAYDSLNRKTKEENTIGNTHTYQYNAISLLENYVNAKEEETTLLTNEQGEKEALTEDLVQIEYENGYLIDLGWYPEYDSYGELLVQVIKNYDWESPIYKEQSRDEKQLKKYY